MNQRAPAGSGEERRPALLLAVYSWDMFLAILAIFGALAPFAGQVAIGQSNEQLSVGLQVLSALASAAYAAALIIVASLLTRRMRWIPRMQIATMALAVLFGGGSLLVAYARGGIDIVPVLVTVLFLLVDVLTIVLMTERRITVWYTDDAAPPRYAIGTLGFWALSSVALIVLDALR